MKRIISLLLIAALVAALLPAFAVPAAAAGTVNIDLIELTDTHGKLGSSSDALAGRLAAAIEQIRQENPNGTIVLGGGDYYTGSSTDISTIFHGAPMQQWLEFIGIDAQVVGNHEFDRSFNEVYGFISDRSELIGCNLLRQDGSLLCDSGSVLITRSGVRILIVGSISELPYTLAGVGKIGDPVVYTKAEIDRYAPSDYDLIIPVCHGDGAILSMLARLADEGYPVACVFGGHSHDTVIRDYYTPGGKHVPICVAPAYNEGLGHIRLSYDRQTKTAAIAEVTKENNILPAARDQTAESPYYNAYMGAWKIVKDWEAGENTLPSAAAPGGREISVVPAVDPNAPCLGSCGNNLQWSLSNGVLTITGSGDMYDYGQTPAPWLLCGETITGLQLPDGLTKISAWAFAGCSCLAELKLPVSLREIGRYAFYGCTALQKAIIPQGVTTIGTGAFRCCTSLSGFSLPDSAVCLGSCIVKETPFYKQEKQGNALLYIGRHLIEVPTTVSGSLCIAEGTVSIADQALEECSSITALKLPDGLLRIGDWAFIGCGLLALTMPDSVTYLGEAACYGDSKLASVTFGSGIETVGQDAFNYCGAIKNTYICDLSRWCMASFGNKFSNPTYFSRALVLNGKQLTSVQVPDGVTHIGQYAFCLCSSITEVTLPASVTEIGEYAFFYCDNLTKINIPDGVAAIRSSCFENCYCLGGIVLPKTVQAVEKNAFAACSRLRYVIFTGNPPAMDAAAFANAAPSTTACVYYPVSSAWEEFPKTGYGGNLRWLPLEGALTAAAKYTIDADGQRIAISGTGGMPSISGFDPWPFTALQQFVCHITFDRSISGVSAWSFSGMAQVEAVVLPKNITVVSNDALRGCTALKEVYVLNPQCTFGAEPLTLGVPGYTVICGYSGSTAETFAKQNGYTFCAIGSCASGHVYEFTGLVKPTCTQGGYSLYTCALCGKTKTEEKVPACPHRFENGVCVICGGGANDPCLGYTDISRGKWYHSAADFVIARGIMGSTQTNALTFEPNTTCTRSMIVSILYRLEGSPAVTFEAKFPDVKAGKWFSDAVIWAAQNGIVSGYGNGSFGPNDKISREQMAVILKGYTEFKGKDTSARADLSTFPDNAKVKWSKDAVCWAVAAGLISGKSNNGQKLLDPQGSATRAEVASILMRFI